MKFLLLLLCLLAIPGSTPAQKLTRTEKKIAATVTRNAPSETVNLKTVEALTQRAAILIYRLIEN